jgi:hypothetical protein
MVTLFWALLCILTVITIYIAASMTVWMFVLGADIYTAFEQALNELAFWRHL